MSNTVVLVVVVAIVLAMGVMMVRYAKFIHNYPKEVEKEGQKEADEFKKTNNDPEKQ